jgi:hypothetical protein
VALARRAGDRRRGSARVKVCTISTCFHRLHARGLCRAHYLRVWRYGDSRASDRLDRRNQRRSRLRVDRLSLFNAKWVEDSNGCWIWQGGQNDQGYGTFFDGRTRRAHRWSFEHFRGPIPPGMPLDHLCRVRLCVNPWHLEVVTASENARRRDHNRGEVRPIHT